jgi:Mg2+ and Co2+ transporter CorA
MIKIENVTSKLCEYLSDAVYDMLSHVEDENYELANSIKKDIDKKILQIENLIISKDLTTMNREELNEQLVEVKDAYIKIWTDYLNIPEERTII